MHSITMIDPLYSLLGFCVGVLVGMTGMGGGSLMTPLLILLFGVHPAAAVGTDLLYAAITKTGGSLVRGFSRSIDWPVVWRLASGSIPASVVTIIILSRFDLDGDVARSLITSVLSIVMFVTAFLLIFGKQIVAVCSRRISKINQQSTTTNTALVGILIGVLVSVSSVGAGAIGVIALVLLYPQLPMHKIVGTDIAHAVPLTFVAGLGHWMIGSVDLHIVISLLVGSLPGIVISSYYSIRIPERALQLVLAATLLVVASRIAYDHTAAASSLFAKIHWRTTN